jgi:hypothetical protein
MVVAVPQAPSKAAGARGQPARKARRLGSRLVLSHPGRAANETSTYWARSAAGFGGGHTGHGFSGSCVHPALSRIRSQTNRAMWIVYLEMLLAFALAAFIVWFTWPRKPK